MTAHRRKVFVTGATGCVGHYVVEALLERGDCDLTLLVRDPAKFRLVTPPDAPIRWVVDDIVNVAAHAEVLAEMDAVVHLATAWGDPISYATNVDATLAIAALTDPARCRIQYFSTASIMDNHNQVWPEAEREGTDYIRSKYLAYQALRSSPHSERVTALFPTLIFGGSPHHPHSHLTLGLPLIARYLWLLRHFRLDGSLHFIHAADIARMVSHLLDHPAPTQDLVLGNAALTIDKLIAELCSFYALPRQRSFDLTGMAGLVSAVAGQRMNSWDRFSLTHRHFTYTAHNPRALGLEPGLESIHQILAERQVYTGRSMPVLI